MGGTIPGWLLARAGQDITVEPYAGAGARGPTYGSARTVRALVEHKRRLVRTIDGSQVTSETTVRMRLDEVCPVESRVTVAGRTATVITSAPIDGGSLPVPSHLEVTLT